MYIFFFIKEVYASILMALAGVELQMLVYEPDALTTRPPLWAYTFFTELFWAGR